jgi:hypothetical protein
VRLEVLLPILIALTACSNLKEQQEQQAHEYVVQAIASAPPWMMNPPNEEGVIYGIGTAVNADWNMADYIAKVIAYSKICMTAGGIASQRTQVNRTETDRKFSDFSQVNLSASCKSVDMSGVEVKEVKHVAEGTKFRTFVLIALPIKGFINK